MLKNRKPHKAETHFIVRSNARSETAATGVLISENSSKLSSLFQ